jgi:hypothetical protein
MIESSAVPCDTFQFVICTKFYTFKSGVVSICNVWSVVYVDLASGLNAISHSYLVTLIVEMILGLNGSMATLRDRKE